MAMSPYATLIGYSSRDVYFTNAYVAQASIVNDITVIFSE